MGRPRRYCPNVTLPLLRPQSAFCYCFPSDTHAQKARPLRMSDTFEFSIPDQNRGGNLPADILPRRNPRESARHRAIAQPQPRLPTSASADVSRADRRSRRRALISAPVRVRSVDVTDGGPDEISTTLGRFPRRRAFRPPRAPYSKSAWLSQSPSRTANRP